MTAPDVARELHKAIHSFNASSLYSQLLTPWVTAHPEVRGWLLSFAARPGLPVPTATPEELWELYALSRVSQTLLLRFQSGRPDGTDWPGPSLTISEYSAFFTSLGFTEIGDVQFAPFHHEIVAVEQAADDAATVRVRDVLWPGLMLGDLMFSRAGVRVTGGRKWVEKTVAESSTLYWAYQRKNRPCRDESHGWGSNSQWRTSFRRDYLIKDQVHFNADAERDPFTPEDGDLLTPAERIELLTNRCFIATTKPHDDCYPYDLRHTAALSDVV